MDTEIGVMLLQAEEPKIASNHQKPGERHKRDTPTQPLGNSDLLTP